MAPAGGGQVSRLAAVRADLVHAALLFDLDGTLARIVAHPEDARVVDGMREAIEGLVVRAALVAVVTGRPEAFVREQLPVEELRVVGLYGLAGATPIGADVHDAVETAAAREPGAAVEDKTITLAVHVRSAPDPDAAERRLRPALAAIAARHGLALLEGKRVLEIAPADGGGKGGVVRELVAGSGATAVLYAGDDLADLDAFAELDELAGSGLAVCKVAVLGDEVPLALREAADIVVAGPEELLGLLGSL